MKNFNYTKLSKDIYQQNKDIGWWDDPNRCIYQTLQLVSTEIAEATEGERKDLMDDHLPHRKAGEVELADALIRVLDIGGRYGFTIYDSMITIHTNVSSTQTSIGCKHFFLNVALVDFSRTLTKDLENPSPFSLRCYTRLLMSIVAVADGEGYDIEGALYEKLEYNKNRADHKRENRVKDGGKEF